MAVFTCFSHGTSANRASGAEKGELVHVLSQLVNGNEALVNNGVLQLGNFLINEGPGATKGDLAHPSVNNPFTGTEKGIHTGGSDFTKEVYGETPKHWAVSGLLSGGGWSDNVARTVFIIQALKLEHGMDITTVNMTGWSRGAVTCIRIANRIAEVFGETIECNIFCVDPVAGLKAGLEKEDTRILPSCVKNFFAVLSMHERRDSFKPQDLSRMQWNRDATRVLYLPMGGTHSQQPIRKVGVEETHDISISMIYAFLRHFGTDFTAPPPHYVASARDMCEKYAEMRHKLDQGLYKKKQTSAFKFDNRVQGSLSRRDFAKTANMPRYVLGGKTSYWVNEHHRACFKLAYPDLHSLIFGQPRQDRTKTVNVGGIWNSALLQSLIERDFCFNPRLHSLVSVNVGAGWYLEGGGLEQLHADWPMGIPVV